MGQIYKHRDNMGQLLRPLDSYYDNLKKNINTAKGRKKIARSDDHDSGDSKKKTEIAVVSGSKATTVQKSDVLEIDDVTREDDRAGRDNEGYEEFVMKTFKAKQQTSHF